MMPSFAMSEILFISCLIWWDNDRLLLSPLDYLKIIVISTKCCVQNSRTLFNNTKIRLHLSS